MAKEHLAKSEVHKGVPITAYHSQILHYFIPTFCYISIPHYFPLDLEMIPTACLLD